MTIKNIFNISVATLLVTLFCSCEDVVEVDLENGSSQLIVDAFVSDMEAPVVTLIQSQNYFDNSELEYVSDATVIISSETEDFPLAFDGTSYTAPSAIDFEDGMEYKLTIQTAEDLYEAFSVANPVPEIDTIQYEFEEGLLDNPDGFLAEFRAIDNPGQLDHYWVKHYRNGEYSNDPTALIIAADAAFGGDGTDGFLFIPPIRFGVNNFDSLYQVDEHLRVELLSINEEIWEFLGEVIEQSTNEGITATPSYNLRSNITHVSGPDELGALGNFSVSKMSSFEITFE